MDAVDMMVEKFFSKDTNKETRKFILLMFHSMLPLEGKKQILKEAIDNCDEKAIDSLIDVITDAMASDDFAASMRDVFKKKDS